MDKFKNKQQIRLNNIRREHEFFRRTKVKLAKKIIQSFGNTTRTAEVFRPITKW